MKQDLSLDTLTPIELDRIMDEYRRQKRRAEDHYTTQVEPLLIHRREVCRAGRDHYRAKFPRLSESSEWTSRDVKTTIDWILPLLLEAFCSSDDAVSVQGVSAEDDEAARRIQALLKYQIERKNRYFVFLHSVLRSALEVNLGIGKVYWHREEKATPYETILTARDRAGWDALRREAHQGTIRITALTPIDAHHTRVSYQKLSTTANHPVLEYLPPSEFRYTPDGLTIDDAQFRAHRKIVTADYLKRREKSGIYQNVDQALANAGTPLATAFDTTADNARTNARLTAADGANRRVELYEGYLDVDYNGDGIAEKIIIHAVGDIPLRIAANEFGQAPFFTCSGEFDPNASFGETGFADNLEQLQDLKTALVRQIIINIAKNNAPRQFIDERTVDMDALLAGDEYIPVSGEISASIYCPPPLPLSSATMDLINYTQAELEAQSGSTRYNQGLDADSLNKTATGITTIMGAADKRVRLLARHIAETFLLPLFRFLIRLNRKFLDRTTLVRLLGEDIRIDRTDLDLDYDLIINLGQNLTTKTAELQHLAHFIEKLCPILAAQGVITRENWHHIAKQLLERIGIKNTARYLTEQPPAQAQTQGQGQTPAQGNVQAQAQANAQGQAQSLAQAQALAQAQQLKQAQAQMQAQAQSLAQANAQVNAQRQAQSLAQAQMQAQAQAMQAQTQMQAQARR